MTTSDQVPGRVALVGAGPGDPALLTVKARRLLDAADVVLHDSLCRPALLETISAGTDVLDVGKKPGPDGDRTTQATINRLMVEEARLGRHVVRLKAGDPTVFARGGEEAEHLAAAGVPFEVVPGVSSVLTPGRCGLPLTHRDHASSVTVVTGHEDPAKPESALDWGALADLVAAGGTLVILMGVGRLPDNLAALSRQSLPAETPVAMVEKATWAEERTVTGTLDSIEAVAREHDIEPPALTVVGDVVEVRKHVWPAMDRSTGEDATWGKHESKPRILSPTVGPSR